MPRTDTTTTPGMIPRLRAVPAGLAAVATLVVLSTIFSRDPIRDAATFADVSEVSLAHPMGYLLMAPISNVLDMLTLLSLRQHIAFVLTVIACYSVWWWLVGRSSLRHIPSHRRWLRELARIGVGLTVLAGLYVSAVLLPRPMAFLERTPGIIAVDFHSHTMYSHDGRRGWTPEDVRQWHADAGYDVAYISDHRTFEGARAGWTNNADHAGDKTVLIPAIEVGWHGEHINVLDADRMYLGLLTDDKRDIDDRALQIASKLPNNEPVLIETLPGDPRKAKAAGGPGTDGIRAIEIIDGSPKGLGQTRREHAIITHLADSLNLALVAGSDHHGWGHAAAGWTLLLVRDWRGLSPGDLSVRISRILRNGGRAATRVVARYVPDTDAPAVVPFTVPLVAWGMLRTLSSDERGVWLAWTVVLFLLWKVRDIRERKAHAARVAAA